MSNDDSKFYTFVTYGPETDAVYAIYAGTFLERAGDDYHTKMSSVIKGWCACLRRLGKADEIQCLEIPASKCKKILNGEPVPEFWPNKYSKHANIGAIP